jgi:outer membrane immunogenic protein
MKRLVFSLGIAVALSGAGRLFAGPEAIDTKDYKAQPEPIVVEKECRWTGFYIGGHGGYAWGGDSSFLELDESDPSFDFERSGFFGGGQAGFNLQLGSWFVIGVEGTFSAGDFNDNTRIDKGADFDDGHLDTDWIATVGGRLGVSFCKNRLLAYLKGGAAFTDYDFDTHEVGDNGRFHASDDETMALVGVGLEYAFLCHWTIKIEYNHLFADDDNNVTGVETDGSTRENRTFHVDQDDWDLVEAGLNFKF